MSISIFWLLLCLKNWFFFCHCVFAVAWTWTCWVRSRNEPWTLLITLIIFNEMHNFPPFPATNASAYCSYNFTSADNFSHRFRIWSSAAVEQRLSCCFSLLLYLRSSTWLVFSHEQIYISNPNFCELSPTCEWKKLVSPALNLSVHKQVLVLRW